MTTTDAPPDFLTIEEAAHILRIGRTVAYAQAKEWRTTGGASGLPVVSFGRVLRVPRAALVALAGGELTAINRDEPEPDIPTPTTPRTQTIDPDPIHQPTPFHHHIRSMNAYRDHLTHRIDALASAMPLTSPAVLSGPGEPPC